MKIIELKNLSKYYYNKGLISSGLNKINLSFENNGFIVITGQSGSGKTTLLNIIAGLDSYEDGEMYINGFETSHYTEKDYEIYRKKYIGNIFQNFNLIGSYTVYQNIELILLLNGYKKYKIKKKVIELINMVGLQKQKKTKVSKLSGGQKQRVAIARALAKDTSIILADEPTGNLDSQSANEIMALLYKISLNKLVIVVTHNLEQAEQYANRKIVLHDGKILEDNILKIGTTFEEKNMLKIKNLTLFNKIRLAIRNTFNIVPKFFLIIFVYLFMILSLISSWTVYKNKEYVESKNGYNYIFSNNSDKRIIIKKKDHTAISESDYGDIRKIDNIDFIVKNDLLLDSVMTFTDKNNYVFSGYAYNMDSLKENVDIGRMPENEYEIVLGCSKNDEYVEDYKKIFDKEFFIEMEEDNVYPYEIKKTKIVGIKYIDSDYEYIFYLSDYLLNIKMYLINIYMANIKITFQNNEIYGSVFPSDKVPPGTAYISKILEDECINNNCINQLIKINLKNIYYEEKLDLVVSNSYNKDNAYSLLGITDYENVNGSIFINTEDYNKLYEKGNYQSSIFVNEIKDINITENNLEKIGYKTLKIKDTLVKTDGSLSEVVFLSFMILLIIVLYFISYFVIRLILKSRNKYFTTLRILGANKTIIKQLIVTELFIIFNIAFIFIILLICNFNINFEFVKNVKYYLSYNEYFIIYVSISIISFLIGIKFSGSLFKKSIMNTISEEV